METILIGGLLSAACAVLGLFWKEVNRKINCKVNQELCNERSRGIITQLERQEKILLSNEQSLVRIEKKLAYLNGERNGEHGGY
jgi:hypothetical protein